MVDFGISLKQEKNPDTQYFEFILEPPLESLTTFPSEDTVLSKGLSAQTKMLLSAEVDRERIRRMMKNRHSENTLNDVTNTVNSQTPKKSKELCPAMQAVIRPKKASRKYFLSKRYFPYPFFPRSIFRYDIKDIQIINFLHVIRFVSMQRKLNFATWWRHFSGRKFRAL
mgnify:CR=1 FL=1